MPSPPRAPAIVLAPDKFRGALAAPTVCASMARGLRRVWPEADVPASIADAGALLADRTEQLARLWAAATNPRRASRGNAF